MWTAALVLLVVFLSLYDLRTRRVPNWITLPLLAAAVLANFPSQIEVWLVSILLSFAWRLRWIGGGDAKLWMALVWMTPPELSDRLPLAFSFSLLATGALQILWRKARRLPAAGTTSPAAWRALPFTLWLYVH
ncbi:MAG: hypothetical protein HPY45_17850 [Anaerolineae bacterium]|nr:hypothetical protein [Anaerolineae bacterium]